MAEGLRTDSRILDLGTGTGDLVLDARRLLLKEGRSHDFLGIDVSFNMLRLARRKVSEGAGWIQASAEALPLAAGSVEAVVSAFVLRNLKGIFPAALAEIHRVLVPGGRALLLEMHVPEGVFLRGLHRIYLKFFLPLIGAAAFGKDWSQDYLADTIFNFGSPEAFRKVLAEHGFEDVRSRGLNGGIAVLHSARKPFLKS